MTTCWVCRNESQPFYEVEDVPTSSCVLHLNTGAALAQSVGCLELAVCTTCGFIQNDRFSMDEVDYLAPYEESQGSSATFRSFMEAQVDQIGHRYDLAGKSLVEVGCGKGEWLATACRRLNMTGIGFDPAYVPGRVPPDDELYFEVVVDFVDERTRMYGDLVACRHTLEHVSNPLEFVGYLRRAASESDEGIVFIEVPDTAQILAKGAFWDVYYEHAAYFTKVSLANLLRMAGLEVLDIRHAFGGQYLVAEARPAGISTSIEYPIETIRLADVFSSLAATQTAFWREVMESAAPSRTALWAATSKTVSFLAAVDAPVAAAVDINVAKQGAYLPGSATPVIAPDQLLEIDPDLVVVMNPAYRFEIAEALERLGISCELIALGDGAR